MTTHVFIVDDTTFKYHLEYMFAGTGSGEKEIDFNNTSDTKLYAGNKHAGEDSLVGMMADGCRVRKNGNCENTMLTIYEAERLIYLIREKNSNPISNDLRQNFLAFNTRKGILPLKYIEYEIVNNDIVFKEVEYLK
ncbi:MAG: hypothetical protein MSA36_01610 [Treponema porcinum]|uniref:hypothetical protein n=1 Tax=Treponema porcinum TaxID=261392 RepID=UPI0023574BDB|nr:hypothetical protein [Treponema porcinum]MCI7533683.1 hypothetical protein [Treponema porcinum]